jgi:hypothetical protein
MKTQIFERYRILGWNNIKELICKAYSTKEPSRQYLKQLFVDNPSLDEVMVRGQYTEKERRKHLTSEDCVCHILSRFGQLIFLS